MDRQPKNPPPYFELTNTVFEGGDLPTFGTELVQTWYRNDVAVKHQTIFSRLTNSHSTEERNELSGKQCSAS